MSIYEETNVARALLYWAKNNNGNECYYLEDRMYAVADGNMVIIFTADSYDEAKRKAKARHTQERPQGECRTCRHRDPEDKKCDCGEQERQGCPFPVSDDYFCKFYEKGGAE